MRPVKRTVALLLSALALGPAPHAAAEITSFVGHTEGCAGYVLLPNQAPQQGCSDIPVGAASWAAVASSDGDLKVHARASGGVEIVARWAIASARLDATHTTEEDATSIDVSWPYTMALWHSYGTSQFLPPLFATEYGILRGTIGVTGGSCTDGSAPAPTSSSLHFSGVPGNYAFLDRIVCASGADVAAGSVLTASIFLEAEVQAPMMREMYADIEMRAGAVEFRAS